MSHMEDFVPKKKTQVADIERTIYDITNEDRSAYKSQSGLTEEIIREGGAELVEQINAEGFAHILAEHDRVG